MKNQIEKPPRPPQSFSAARTAGNSLNMIATRVSELIFSLFTVIILTRYLGPEHFGIYAFIFTIAFTIKNIVESGVTRIVVREVSANKEKSSEIITAGLTINIFMGGVALVLCAFVAILFNLNTRAEIMALYIALLAQLSLGMVNTVTFGYIAFERTIYNPLVIVSNRILVIGLIVLVIWSGNNFVYIFGAMLLGNLFSLFLALAIFNYKFRKLHMAFNAKEIKYIFRESLPYTASIIMIQISLSMNVFMLKFYNFISEISYYQVSNRLVNAVSTVPTSIFLVMLPFLTRVADENALATLKLAYGRIIKYICALMFPFCILVTVFAPEIVRIMMGPGFAGAVFPLQLMVWTIVPFSVATLSDVMLTSLRKQRVMTLSYGFFFGANLILGLFLIPKYQAIGASVTLVTAITLQFVSIYGFVIKEIGYVSLFRSALRPFISLCAMLALLIWTRDSVHALVLIPASLVLYAVALYLTKTFNEAEKNEIQSLMRRWVFRRRMR